MPSIAPFGGLLALPAGRYLLPVQTTASILYTAYVARVLTCMRGP